MPAPDSKPAAPEAYKPPAIGLGETVLWSAFPGAESAPAIVTKLCGRTLNMTVFPDGVRAPMTTRGVRHATDPDIKKMVETPGGVWEATALGKKIQECLV